MARRGSLLVFLVLLGFAEGCDSDDGVSVYISSNLAKDEECVIAVTNQIVTRGTFNVEQGQYYEVFPLFVSQVRNRGSDLRADPNFITIQGAEVELRSPDGAPIDFGDDLPNPFTISSSFTVPSGTDADPGEAVGYFQIIPTAYADALANSAGVTQVVASVKAFGKTGGDVDVETDEWLWPIDICRDNCLYVCASEDLPAQNSCYDGQDFTAIVNCE